MTRSLIFVLLVCCLIHPSLQAQDNLVTRKAELQTAFNIIDTLFSKPFIDLDEWRNEPLRHRYVHGGFEGTETRFSIYLPPDEDYQGRFFQYITPIPDSENLSQNAQTPESDKIAFALNSGAYFVETNGGGAIDFSNPGVKDPTIGAYRANAASAQFSRIVAKELFGGDRPFGYVFGGSGGSLRTIGSVENTSGVWDGAVPYVMPTPMSIPNSFTAGMLARRVLKDKIPAVVDALRVGSEKDVYQILDTEEQIAVYDEVTALGFPPGAWRADQGEGSGMGGFAVIYPSVRMIDSGYFTDFWSQPGYEGYNPSPSLQKDRIQLDGKITEIITAEEALDMGLDYDPFGDESRGLAGNAWKALIQKGADGTVPVAIRLDSIPADKAAPYDLVITTGDAKGKNLNIQRIEGDIVILSLANNEAAEYLRQGDILQFDNSNFLAVQYYHRHQVPGSEYYVYDQYKDDQGVPKYTQRPMLLGPMFAAAASGSVPSGNFKGKMIILQNMHDGGAFPWHADWYRNRAKEFLGDQVDENLRIWFTDHANHNDYPSQPEPTRDIVYLGVLQQALRDLSNWVEKGIEPPLNTNYRVENGQVILPETARDRRGIQPVARITVQGQVRKEVKVGQQVVLEAVLEVPENAGKIVSAAWHLEGGMDFVAVPDIDSHYLDASGSRAKVRITHVFKEAGTYFPTIRIASQREGDYTTPFTNVKNLGSARLIVRQ